MSLNELEKFHQPEKRYLVTFRHLLPDGDPDYGADYCYFKDPQEPHYYLTDDFVITPSKFNKLLSTCPLHDIAGYATSFQWDPE